MNYRTLSFHALRKLFELHQIAAREIPELLTECDHAERHAIAMELDRRVE